MKITELRIFWNITLPSGKQPKQLNIFFKKLKEKKRGKAILPEPTFFFLLHFTLSETNLFLLIFISDLRIQLHNCITSYFCSSSFPTRDGDSEPN